MDIIETLFMLALNSNQSKLTYHRLVQLDYIDVRENRRGNANWRIQRNWKHRVHKTKTNKANIQRNWKHKVHKTKTNKTKIQRNWKHRVHKRDSKSINFLIPLHVASGIQSCVAKNTWKNIQ